MKLVIFGATGGTGRWLVELPRATGSGRGHDIGPAGECRGGRDSAAPLATTGWWERAV